MVALNPAGGRETTYKLTWYGGHVAERIGTDITTVTASVANQADAWLKTNLHRLTGEMAATSFAVVDVTEGGRRKLIIGSHAKHTFYHEVQPIGHPQLRECADLFAPIYTQEIRKKLKLS